MHIEQQSRSLAAISGLILSIAALTAVVLSGVGYRLGLWHFTLGLQVTEWAVYGAAVALLLSIRGLLQTWTHSARRGRVVAIIGFLLALVPLGMALQWQYATRTYPAINDISTDTVDAPVFWDMPTPSEYPGVKTAEIQRAAYPDLASLKLAQPSAKAYAFALKAVTSNGWTLVASVPEEGRIEATTSSLIYGFVDEVAIRVKAVDGGALVDMRSRSRLGKIDRGVNAKRIRAYLADLQQRASESLH
jgi:uncharacterized protein (DUF1499 family)/drug/metabolite transporter superfamily protein YnfA